MFALETIPTESFICEYKTTGVYMKEEFESRDKKYTINSEFSTSVEAKINGKICFFDATQRYNQFGRYLNQCHPEQTISPCLWQMTFLVSRVAHTIQGMMPLLSLKIYLKFKANWETIPRSHPPPRQAVVQRVWRRVLKINVSCTILHNIILL